MRTESDGYKMTPFEVVMKYIGVAVAIVYIGMGIAIAFFSSQDLFNLPRNYSTTLGCLLIVYGIFRAYRVFSKYFQK